MNPDSLQQLLEAVAQGKTSPSTALEKLKYLGFESLDHFAKIDHHRHLRTGFPEIIWGQDKTPEQIIQSYVEGSNNLPEGSNNLSDEEYPNQGGKRRKQRKTKRMKQRKTKRRKQRKTKRRKQRK
jgi:NCAIR mutase (PurE)-related protein